MFPSAFTGAHTVGSGVSPTPGAVALSPVSTLPVLASWCLGLASAVPTTVVFRFTEHGAQVLRFLFEDVADRQHLRIKSLPFSAERVLVLELQDEREHTEHPSVELRVVFRLLAKLSMLLLSPRWREREPVLVRLAPAVVLLDQRKQTHERRLPQSHGRLALLRPAIANALKRCTSLVRNSELCTRGRFGSLRHIDLAPAAPVYATSASQPRVCAIAKIQARVATTAR